MRDNENRLNQMTAADVSAATVPVQTAQSTQLNFSTPTEFVELPSKGLLYPEAHPMRGRSSVEIKFMTAKEEDILTSRSLIKKGVAIDRMLESLLVDKNIKVDQLLLGDKNALVVAARISGYGADYKTTITCPNCSTNVKHTFNLQSLKTHFCETPEDFGASLTPISTYVFKLPKTDATVEIRPMYGTDENNLVELAEKKKKMNLPEETSTTQMKTYVLSVNGTRDKKVVNNFIDNLPAMDARHLRLVYKQLIPNVDLTHDFVCSACSHEQEVEVPFTVDFFWPK